MTNKNARLIAMALAGLLVAPAARAEAARDPVEAGLAFRKLMAMVSRKATGEAEPAPCTSPTERGGCLDASSATEGASWDGKGSPPAGTTRDVPGNGTEAMVARGTPGSWMDPGENCALATGYGVEALGTDPVMGDLVRVSVPATHGKSQPGACPDGTLAFLATGTMATWPNRGEVAAKRKAIGDRVAAAADRILPPNKD